MSWLFVAFIPGLLMLATFGLERIERGLQGEAADTDDVADFLRYQQSERTHRRSA